MFLVVHLHPVRRVDFGVVEAVEQVPMGSVDLFDVLHRLVGR